MDLFILFIITICVVVVNPEGIRFNKVFFYESKKSKKKDNLPENEVNEDIEVNDNPLGNEGTEASSELFEDNSKMGGCLDEEE